MPTRRRMSPTAEALPADLWWKNAVVYCLDVETFQDSNGDGYGDFRGLTGRMDYLANLGITCLWLMPFYPSPNRDDGYDIVDYYAVDPRLGTLGDFVTMLRAAHERGIRIIIDLVVNHTSDQHPWFQQARRDPDSPYRDFYVWRDEPLEDPDLELMFPGYEEGVWSWDGEAQQYYLHHFLSQQPDLHISNPEVRAEIKRIAGFWLQLGVDGFRVDAVPLLLLTEASRRDIGMDPHRVMVDLRNFVSRRRGDAILLGEVNEPYEELIVYFGEGRELDMLFDFPLMQALHLALARSSTRPLTSMLSVRPRKPSEAQWATFVRNHDELTLDQRNEEEIQEVFEAFGPDPSMQIFGRGIRRRLPPMLGGDPRRLRLVYSLLLTLPGTPVLFYGEEIGMGENLDIPDRLSVRTPMQWSSEPGGGFSTAELDSLVRPPPQGEYGPKEVNVAEQIEDHDSLLRWMQRAVRARRETPAFGWGDWSLLETDSDSVLAVRCDWLDSTVVSFHNFSNRAEVVTVSPGDQEFDVVTIFGEGQGALRQKGDQLEVELVPYGLRWIELELPPT